MTLATFIEQIVIRAVKRMNPDNLETLESNGDIWNWRLKQSKKGGMWHSYSLAKRKQWKQDAKEKDASKSSSKAHSYCKDVIFRNFRTVFEPKKESSKKKKAASVLCFLDKGGGDRLFQFFFSFDVGGFCLRRRSWVLQLFMQFLCALLSPVALALTITKIFVLVLFDSPPDRDWRIVMNLLLLTMSSSL